MLKSEGQILALPCASVSLSIQWNAHSSYLVGVPQGFNDLVSVMPGCLAYGRCLVDVSLHAAGPDQSR